MKFYSLLVLGLGCFLIGSVHGQSALADENVVVEMGSEVYGSAEDWQIVGEQLQKNIECRFIEYSDEINIYTVLKPMFREQEYDTLRDFTYKTVPPASFRVAGMPVEYITVVTSLDEWARFTATVRMPYAKVQRKVERFNRRYPIELELKKLGEFGGNWMVHQEREIQPNAENPALTDISCYTSY